jgi:hypothetical protein
MVRIACSEQLANGLNYLVCISTFSQMGYREGSQTRINLSIPKGPKVAQGDYLGPAPFPIHAFHFDTPVAHLSA